MKKFISLFICLILMLSLFACGSKSEKQESSVTPTEASKEAESKIYENSNGWKIKYIPDVMKFKETEAGAEFVYAKEASKTNSVNISYVKDKQPQEVLYEHIADIADEKVTRSEGFFGATRAWAFTYSVNDIANDGFFEQLSAIEHNDGVLLIDIKTYDEKDEAKSYAISDSIAELVDTIEFTNHKPQTAFSYVIGEYVRKYTEEIDGKKVEVEEKVVLKEDHTGTLSFQDDVPIYWTSIEIREDGGTSYEYTVEGDCLYLNLDGEWLEFERK